MMYDNIQTKVYLYTIFKELLKFLERSFICETPKMRLILVP